MNGIASEYLELTANHHSRNERLAATILLTEKMLASAKSGDWGQVAETERCRRALLDDCFKVNVADAESNVIAEAIAVLLHLNEELVSLIQAAKKVLASDCRADSLALASVDHYLAVQEGANP